jgi:RimJ/RimL family protein N-acetyltransferase
VLALPLGVDGAELRALEPWHAEEFLAHLDRGRDSIGEHIGLADAVTDAATSREYLRSYAERAAADTGRIHGIWSGGRLVGGVVLPRLDVGRGLAEVGCWLEPAATGRGLVTLAVRALIDWLVRDRGVHRVEWLVAPGNAPSIAVARRLGMTREGVLREYYPHRGRRLDIEVWSVLAHEWRRA